MNILYLECNMGAAGDMLMSALYELLENKESFIDTMNHLGLPGVRLKPLKAASCGISGTRIEVTVHGEEESSVDVHHEHHLKDDHPVRHHHGTHEHQSFSSIEKLIKSLPLPAQVIHDALAVYGRLAAAESSVHGKAIEQLHFHEVGALDAVADVTGVCYAMYLLQVEKVFVSPINVGKGHVHCAHGIVPVPAPATTKLLLGVPIYSSDIQGELCTPTGAVLLTYFADSYGQMPTMITEKCGYGIGKKSFQTANCVRAFIGYDETTSKAKEPVDEITELCCNLDDMTPEALGFACEELMTAGALDVYITPIQMKKGRCGMLLTLLCKKSQINKMAKHLFIHTLTNGIRIKKCEKLYLKPGKEMVSTRYGDIAVKTAKGYGVYRKKPEYEDVAKIARDRQLPFKAIWDAAFTAINQSEYNSNE